MRARVSSKSVRDRVRDRCPGIGRCSGPGPGLLSLSRPLSRLLPRSLSLPLLLPRGKGTGNPSDPSGVMMLPMENA